MRKTIAGTFLFLFVSLGVGSSQDHLAVAGGCAAHELNVTTSCAPTRYREVVLTASNASSVSAQSSQPDLALKDIHGRSFKLSDFKGKVVLLNFWATWCPPCRKEIPQLIKLQREYRKAGLQIIGITYPPEKLSAVRAFARRSQTNYPLVLGSERTKSSFTSSDVLPVSVVIDRVGNVREVIEGILLPEEIDEKIKPLLSDIDNDRSLLSERGWPRNPWNRSHMP